MPFYLQSACRTHRITPLHNCLDWVIARKVTSGNSGKLVPLCCAIKAKTVPNLLGSGLSDASRSSAGMQQNPHFPNAITLGALLAPIWHAHCKCKWQQESLMSNMVTISNLQTQAGPLDLVDARIQDAIHRIAQTESTVLIVGEYGAGKQAVAEQIHSQSNRSSLPFAVIQSGRTSATQLSTALASPGTLYLLEVGEISLALQELILNRRLHNKTHCRLLCGSVRELQNDVMTGRLREDFFYLISAVSLRVPPLRCRRADILAIADQLLTLYSNKFGRPKPALTGELVEMLMEHSWPENLPELKTAMQTIVAIDNQAISIAAIRAAHPSRRSNAHRHNLQLKEATKASSIMVERQLISEVLDLTSGNRKRAAVQLGISYKALLYKLKRMQAEDKIGISKSGVIR